MNDLDPNVTRRRPLARWLAIALVPVAAIAVAWFATRGSGAGAAAAVDEHAGHGVVLASSSAQPVTLSAADAQRIGVTYAVASIAPVEREIRTVGQVTFDETRVTAISPKIDGWIERLYVNFEGQPIAAGTPLFAIHSPMLVTAQEELLLARRLVTEVTGGDAGARAGAESLLSSARRRLEYWDVPAADIARIEASGQVQRTVTLRSPVNGFVVEKNVLRGQRVMAGEALYRIADLRTVWVEGEVFERDLGAVRLGQLVAVELDALPGRGLRSRITYIYPTLDRETRTSKVRVELTNPGFQLKPGMYATLRWPGRGAIAALTVPRSAVVSTGERHLVFAKRGDGMLEPRQVEVGASSTDRIEILRGLVVGDTVVASATFLLDAESNLGALLGGMGDMPGMDMTAPKKPEDSSAHKNH